MKKNTDKTTAKPTTRAVTVNNGKKPRVIRTDTAGSSAKTMKGDN